MLVHLFSSKNRRKIKQVVQGMIQIKNMNLAVQVKFNNLLKLKKISHKRNKSNRKNWRNKKNMLNH